MSRRQIVFLAVLFFLVGIPAYAYGDPTGGSLFQFLLPMLAALWAMFLIFANRIRRAIVGFMGKLRRSKTGETASPEARDKTFQS
jgi:hypothetical protein